MPAARVFADGVLVIDKPSGPTSHDVVAVVRRAARTEPVSTKRDSAKTDRSTIKVGHTGTLDPIASGVLPIVIGKATRLAQFLSSAEKEYDAEIELGVSTTTLDRTGDVVARHAARRVTDVTEAMIDEAIAGLRGTYQQQPPAFSAKKVEGDRAYDLARRNASVSLQPVTVTASVLDVIEWRGHRLRLHLRCSAGYYVRSLAAAIGERLETGAHLSALIRTRSGDFALEHAVGLDAVVERPETVAAHIVPLSHLLPSLPAVTLTPDGAALAVRGGFLGAPHVSGSGVLATLPSGSPVRLLHPDGRLLAIGKTLEESSDKRPRHFLHPGVVLE
jgi:tRNA pseudouridine55 synthase